jgi:hypothetical protein
MARLVSGILATCVFNNIMAEACIFRPRFFPALRPGLLIKFLQINDMGIPPELPLFR